MTAELSLSQLILTTTPRFSFSQTNKHQWYQIKIKTLANTSVLSKSSEYEYMRIHTLHDLSICSVIFNVLRVVLYGYTSYTGSEF